MKRQDRYTHTDTNTDLGIMTITACRAAAVKKGGKDRKFIFTTEEGKTVGSSQGSKMHVQECDFAAAR